MEALERFKDKMMGLGLFKYITLGKAIKITTPVLIMGVAVAKYIDHEVEPVKQEVADQRKALIILNENLFKLQNAIITKERQKLKKIEFEFEDEEEQDK